MSTPKTTLYPITDRQLATVLAALRYWQRDLSEGAEDSNDVPEGIIDGAGHFTDHKPLTSDEIDELCESLNIPDEHPAAQFCNDPRHEKAIHDARQFALALGKDKERLVRALYLCLAYPDEIKDNSSNLYKGIAKLIHDVTGQKVDEFIKRYQLSERP